MLSLYTQIFPNTTHNHSMFDFELLIFVLSSNYFILSIYYLKMSQFIID